MRPRPASSARLIGEAGMDMVFGGGDIGLMGEAARAVRAAGRKVTGILPEFLRHLEPPLTNGELVEITTDLQERKRRMLALSDGFVILPGGLGTLDEFFEVITRRNWACSPNPSSCSTPPAFYAPLKALLAMWWAPALPSPKPSRLCRFVATPQQAMAALTEGFVRTP